METWLEPVAEGTEVRMRWQGHGTLLPTRLMLPLMRRRIKRQMLHELTTFKALVEERGAHFDHP